MSGRACNRKTPDGKTCPCNASDIFLTDDRFNELFGPEISRVTQVLNETGSIKCSACKGKCCREIGCRFYSEKFDSCPIYELRPRECRYHFCKQLLDEAPLSQEAKEVLQKPLKDLLNSENQAVSKLFSLSSQFPLDSEGLASLGIGEEVNNIVAAFEEGKLDEGQAKGSLRSLCLDLLKQRGK